MTKLLSRPVELQQTFRFSPRRDKVRKSLVAAGGEYLSDVRYRGGASDPYVAWIQSYLRGEGVSLPPSSRTLRVADLFCGSGGLTEGFRLAAEALGCKVDVSFAVDADKAALDIYRWNHGPALSMGVDVQSLVNYHVAGRGNDATWSTHPTIIDPQVQAFVDGLDVVMAGPPCQGHSNLNNKTRRSDVRNLLYLPTVAFAIACKAKLVLIENVPDIVNDRHDVLRTARALFAKSGYKFADDVLSADEFGVPQRRRRHFLVAVRESEFEFDLNEIASSLKIGPLTVRDAIQDLLGISPSNDFDSVGKLSEENVRRIDWLFERNEHNLPDDQRPVCHQAGHTYPSVYGRMYWDEPAQTITTGYLSPGRGRYIHPDARRTITPHEAARLQSFSDTYQFLVPDMVSSRSLLQKVIGDAVPPLLGRAVGIAGLSLMFGAAAS